MAQFIMGIISLSVGVVVLAGVFLATVKGTSTCYGNNPALSCTANGTAGYGYSWSVSEITMWGLLSLIGIVGMVYGAMQVFGIG